MKTNWRDVTLFDSMGNAFDGETMVVELAEFRRTGTTRYSFTDPLGHASYHGRTRLTVSDIDWAGIDEEFAGAPTEREMRVASPLT